MTSCVAVLISAVLTTTSPETRFEATLDMDGKWYVGSKIALAAITRIWSDFDKDSVSYCVVKKLLENGNFSETPEPKSTVCDMNRLKKIAEQNPILQECQNQNIYMCKTSDACS